MSRRRILPDRKLSLKERKERHKLNLIHRGEHRVELRMPKRIVSAIDRAADAADSTRAEEILKLLGEALLNRSNRPRQ